jgi:hypothetical protein
MNRSANLLGAARAAALFASDLSANSQPGPAAVTDAIRHAVRAHGGTRGCTIEVAGEYGDHPEMAASRMRWALTVIAAMYPPDASRGPVARPLLSFHQPAG